MSCDVEGAGLLETVAGLELRARQRELAGQRCAALIPPGVPASSSVRSALDAAASLGFAAGVREAIEALENGTPKGATLRVALVVVSWRRLDDDPTVALQAVAIESLG